MGVGGWVCRYVGGDDISVAAGLVLGLTECECYVGVHADLYACRYVCMQICVHACRCVCMHVCM